MQPIRQRFADAPDFIPIPEELRHRHVEVIVRPLEDLAPPTNASLRPGSDTTGADVIEEPMAGDNRSGDYARTKVDRILIPSREEVMPGADFIDTNV